MANVAAISNAKLPTENAAGEQLHYLRAMGPFSPESLATFPSRTTTNRTNAYPQPLAAKSLATGLPSFDTRGCGSGVTRHARPRNAHQPGLQSPHRTRAKKTRRRKRKTLENLLRKSEEIRLRRTDRFRRGPRPRLHPAGALQPGRPLAAPRRLTSTSSNRANRRRSPRADSFARYLHGTPLWRARAVWFA